MNLRCGCTPGDNENGWHETRSEACLAVERDAFARAVELAKGWSPHAASPSITTQLNGGEG